MPPKDLPEQAKKIYMAAEENARKTTCKDRDDVEECSAKIAWSAVKKKYKKEGDKWTPKADVEFSLYITKASFDKKTQEMRFQAVASDTDEDGYNDNMTTELFDTFLDRIESKEEPPEKYRSDYWKGGTPYLSLAHYLDLNGKAVPGTVDSVYKDGNRLKAKGKFHNNALGRACFNNICSDLYDEKRSEADDKIRISIAFLDYKHEHKSNGEVFERKSIDDVCPDCVKETITKILSGKIPEGRKFLDGHLIHLALTRVPVNERTDIIVERSMTTQKEDALSIVGEENEELIDEIENELSSISKSDALITKADESLTQELSEIQDAWRSEFIKEGSNQPWGYVVDVFEDYVVAYFDNKYYKVSYEKSDSKVSFSQRSDWKEVKKKTKWVDILRSLMIEDGLDPVKLLSEHKDEDEEEEDDENNTKKKKESSSTKTKSEVLDMTPEELRELVKEVVQESIPAKEQPAQVPDPHPLDEVLATLKSTYDGAIEQKLAADAVLLSMQEPMETIGRAILEGVQKANPQPTPDTSTEVLKAITQLTQEIALLKAQQAAQPPSTGVPQRRGLTPDVYTQASAYPQSETPKLQSIVRRSVGLSN